MGYVVMIALGVLDVPPVTQSTPYNCGPACLTSVLRFYGVTCFEGELAVACRTDADGTRPADMIRVAQVREFRADAKQHMTLRSLRHHVSRGRPVIVLIRAAGGESHYVVVIGVGEFITLLDPWDGRRVELPPGDFALRWADLDGGPFDRWGLVLRPRS